MSISAGAGLGREAAAPVGRGRSNSPSRPRPTAAGRARTSRPAAARRRSARRSGSDGRTGSRGLARNASASRMRYGHGAVARLRTIASSAIARGKRRRVLGQARPQQQSWRSREHRLFSSRAAASGRSVTVSGEDLGPSERKKGEATGASLFSLVVSILSDLVRAAPLWERSLSDRSYLLSLSVIGMTWTYLRPSLPSRNATRPSVSAKRYGPCPGRRCRPGATWCRAGAR